MKRVLYIFGVLIVSMLLVLSMLVAVLMSDRVQTAAVRWVTEEFAQALGTNAHIGEVHYHFPAHVSIHDIYLEDQHHDTLLYVDEIYVHFRPLALLRDEIKFSHVHVNKAVSKLYQKDGEWNYWFFVEGLGLDKPSDSEPLRQLIAVHDIRFDSIRIDYEDYRMLLSHAEMDLHELKLRSSSLDAQVDELAMQISKPGDASQAPFVVEELNAHLIYNDSIVGMPKLKARLARSRLDMSGIEMRFPQGDSLSLAERAKKTPFNMLFREAEIVPADLSLLAPSLKGMKRPITIHGGVGGTMDSLCCEQIKVHYNGRPFLEGDLSVTGMSDWETAYVKANFKDVQTNAARLQDFLSQWQNRPMQLPKAIHRLGDIHYRGALEGRLHDLRLHGGFRTALGSISTEGQLVSDADFDHMDYTARVAGRNFRLGRLLDQPKLTTMTLDCKSKGKVEDGSLKGDFDAHVKELTYNGYTFSDLHFDGHYEPQQFSGKSSIDDPHMQLAFDGVVNAQNTNPNLNFNLICHHFDLSPFTDDHSQKMETSFKMAVDLDGTQLDELNGYITMDSLYVATDYDSMRVEQIMLTAQAAPDKPKEITLKSDNLHATAEGEFRYVDLVPAFQSTVHRYLPSVVDEPKAGWAPVAVAIRAEGERLRQVQRLFEAPVTISDHTTLAADLAVSPRGKNSPSPFVSLRFFAPGVRAEDTPIHDLDCSLETKGSELVLALSAEVEHTFLKLNTQARRDSLLSNIIFHRDPQNNDSLMAGLTGKELYEAQMSAQRDGVYDGDVHFVTSFSKYAQQPVIELHFDSTEFVLRDSVYRLSESSLAYCGAETWMHIKQFCLTGAGQTIRADGMASALPQDTMSIYLQSMDAAYIVPFILPKKTIMFNGLMTGEADISGIFGQPKVDTKIHIASMGLNDCYFGEAEVDLHIADSLIFHADVDRPDRRVVALDGLVDMTEGGWKLNMQSDRVPLDFINHWTESVLDSLDGYGSGRIVVGDDGTGVYVLLNQMAQDASLTLPWTGARYTIALDSILMDTTSIQFPNVVLTDAYGNPLEINGVIRHNHFDQYELDLHVDTYDALVYDTNIPGEMMQGTVFATGHVDVTGNDMDMLVAADMQTSKNSKFRYSLDNASSAYESNFIHFVEHAPEKVAVVETDLDNIDTKPVRHKNYYVPGGRCLLRLNIDANPFLLFQLMIGERNHDMIQARGNGAISIRYDTQTEDVSMLGSYDMNQGSLSYTVANVIRKEFTIREGSNIVFSGDPSNPRMDVTAKYRVTASLRDLLGDEADQVSGARNNIPVNTCLHMTGPFNNPLMNFSLEFPMSDQSVQQQIQQVINTDEMLMRQVIYLLVFGRFFTPDYMNNAQYATLNSTYSLLSSTVTGQINSWLSKLTNMLTLGVAIRVDGEGSSASQEYEAQFQLTPVDRLVINGNFGYRYNDISNQPFFGDLDVEVLLTEDGQWRLKGYTHTVDKYSLRQASTIQGVGFMWKKDF